MTERSMLWTTNGTGHGVGTGYASDRWQSFLRKMFMSDQVATACVLNQIDNELIVSGVASPLAVASGAAIDHSFFYENDASLNLAVTTPVVGLTGGHVVLEANWAAQTVTARAIRNTDGLSAIPALTQTINTTWQVRLATFTISTGGVITLTDVRKKVKFSNNVYANSFDVSAVDSVTIELGAGALRVKDLGISTAKLANLAITTGKIALLNITTALLADLNVTTGKLADLSVTLGKLALNSVDDTIAGDRVPQFYRRKGGDATNWDVPATAPGTSYTPTAVRMQGGSILSTTTAVSGNITVTFPVAFSAKPLVLVSRNGDYGSIAAVGQATTVTTTGFNLNWFVFDAGGATQPAFNWLAIGSE